MKAASKPLTPAQKAIVDEAMSMFEGYWWAERGLYRGICKRIRERLDLPESPHEKSEVPIK